MHTGVGRSRMGSLWSRGRKQGKPLSCSWCSLPGYKFGRPESERCRNSQGDSWCIVRVGWCCIGHSLRDSLCIGLDTSLNLASKARIKSFHWSVECMKHMIVRIRFGLRQASMCRFESKSCWRGTMCTLLHPESHRSGMKMKNRLCIVRCWGSILGNMKCRWCD